MPCEWPPDHSLAGKKDEANRKPDESSVVTRSLFRTQKRTLCVPGDQHAKARPWAIPRGHRGCDAGRRIIHGYAKEIRRKRSSRLSLGVTADYM